MVKICQSQPVVAIRKLPGQVGSGCAYVAKNTFAVAKKGLINVANFFAAIARGVFNTCSYLKNKTVQVISSGCQKVQGIFRRKVAPLPAPLPSVPPQNRTLSVEDAANTLKNKFGISLGAPNELANLTQVQKDVIVKSSSCTTFEDVVECFLLELGNFPKNETLTDQDLCEKALAKAHLVFELRPRSDLSPKQIQEEKNTIILKELEGKVSAHVLNLMKQHGLHELSKFDAPALSFEDAIIKLRTNFKFPPILLTSADGATASQKAIFVKAASCDHIEDAIWEYLNLRIEDLQKTKGVDTEFDEEISQCPQNQAEAIKNLNLTTDEKAIFIKATLLPDVLVALNKLKTTDDFAEIVSNTLKVRAPDLFQRIEDLKREVSNTSSDTEAELSSDDELNQPTTSNSSAVNNAHEAGEGLSSNNTPEEPAIRFDENVTSAINLLTPALKRKWNLLGEARQVAIATEALTAVTAQPTRSTRQVQTNEIKIEAIKAQIRALLK